MTHLDAGLPMVDLWAEVPFEHLPPPLVSAYEARDWPRVREELRKVMDGVVTDGAYGREILNLVLQLPIGIDPLFDRYRAMTSIDFGDWDGLERCLNEAPTDATEILGIRELLLAPVSYVGLPRWTEKHHKFLFEIINAQLSQSVGADRRLFARIQSYRPVELWTRGDAPVRRHARFRELHDVVFLGSAEALGGRLPVAVALASEAQHLGDEGEPLRVIAADIERLAAAALGDAVPEHVDFMELIHRSTGPSPFGTWQMTTMLLPLIAAALPSSLQRAADVVVHAATGLASPRAHLQAQGWSIAARVQNGDRRPKELPALLAHVRQATLGLRALPQLLNAMSTQRHEHFLEAARTARRSGNVWVQIAALVWATSLSPMRREGRRLYQLLEVTGWRRPVLVPPEVASEAALGLVSLGIRGRAVVELAAVAGRPNVTLEVARRHLDEPLVRIEDKFHALEATAALGTVQAVDALRRLAARHDEVGARAAVLVARPAQPLGLSDREVEVLEMAGSGLTNRQIGEKLSLSPHTIARHLANARGKLGASNRAEAATRLARVRGG